ncbi:MAG: hypothetical protein A4S09_07095 [Proteobacteria bacterium SG_bin7]|nr:MAG: hypothetical protein A4S09_07095 [Proteobacteria bacterium SG_bin7]
MIVDQECAVIPNYLSAEGNTVTNNFLCILTGVVLLSGLAQITIPLPWTPVPITGQTLGVALTALLWGRARGTAVVLGYLVLGAVGVPVFALGRSGISVGPTFGYLLGMIVAAYVMGSMADRGWTRKFWQTYFTAVLGSGITFCFGLIGLSFFIPHENLLAAGLFPFLPGDLIKTFLASSIAFKTQNLWKRNI